MAPELFDGVPASRRSDFYAVGVMYFYLLSARLPYASDQISQLVQKHQRSPIPDVRDHDPSVPSDASEIIARCLAKRPEDRYASAEELASQLQSVVYQLRDTDSLIRESLEGLDCFAQGGSDHYRILFPLPHDRLQEVYVDASHGPSGERLLSIFSVCGPADPKHFEFALRLNDKLSYGSLSVRNVHGDAMFVMNRTFARDHVCAADIRAAMMEIAAPQRPRRTTVDQRRRLLRAFWKRFHRWIGSTVIPTIPHQELKTRPLETKDLNSSAP